MQASLRIRPSPVGAAGFVLAYILAIAATAPGQAPSGSPPPLARYIPRENLVAYIEFDGLDAHADAWRKTAAYKILNNTSTGAMLEDIFVQLVGKIPAAKINGPDALALLKHVARSGFVFASAGDPTKGMAKYSVLVLRDAYKNKDIRPIAARAVQGLAFAPNAKLQSVLRAGHKVASGGNPGGGTSTFWVEDSKKEDIVVVMPRPESADMILETLDGKRPSVVDHAPRANLVKSEDGFVPVLAAFLDLSGWKSSPALDAFGLQEMRRFDYRWGFQDDALMSITRISAPSPRKGALALLDGPGFEKGSLPPMPESVTDFSVTAFDAKATVDKLVEVAKMIRPDAEDRWKQAVDAIKAKTRLRLKEDILARLGPKAAWYVMPAKAGAPATLAAPNVMSTMMAGMGLDQVPKAALIVEVDDSVAFGKVLDELMGYVNREIKAQMAAKGPSAEPNAPRNRRAPAGPSFEFRLMPGETKTYVLGVPPELASMLPATFRPTVRLGPKHVVLAVNSETARAALEAKGTSTPPSDLVAAFRAMPTKLKFLGVSDARDTTPAILASLPAKLQMGINSAIIQAKAQAATAAGGAPPAAPATSAAGGNTLPPPGSRQNTGSGGAYPGMSRGPGPVEGNAPGATPPAEASGTIVLQVDAAKLPPADAIKALLYPSVIAAEVNDEGLRIVTRGAFPTLGDPSKIGAFVQGYDAAVRRARMGGGAMPPGLAPPVAPNAPAPATAPNPVPGPGGRPGRRAPEGPG